MEHVVFMNKTIVSDLSLTPKFTLYSQKALCVWCLIFILHSLLIIWMTHSFHQIIPYQDQGISSSLNSKAIQIRFLSNVLPAKTAPSIGQVKNKVQLEEYTKPSSKLIAATSSQKEFKQQNKVSAESQKLKTAVMQKTETTAQQSESAQSKVTEKTVSSTTASLQNESLNNSENKANSMNNVSLSNHRQTSSASMQKNVASTASTEKSVTVNTPFKAMNRRLNYPTRARALGVEGRIRVQFDITNSGTLSNIRILSENPTGVFTDTVLKDMARWRYQTTSAVKDQVVNIVFKLDGRVVLDN